MIADRSRVSHSTATAPPESGTTTVNLHPVATLEHRTFVHPVTRGDCLECLPAKCVCGRLLCPAAFEHRRELVSSESYWRVSA